MTVHVKDGEWVFPEHKGFRHACCDCGLEHVVNFKLVDGDIAFQVFRDEGATTINRANSNPAYPVIKWVFENLVTDES